MFLLKNDTSYVIAKAHLIRKMAFLADLAIELKETQDYRKFKTNFEVYLLHDEELREHIKKAMN